MIQDTRGDPRPDPAGASSNDPGVRGGRSLSRDRVNNVTGRKDVSNPGTQGDEPPPPISSADLDQLMADFDLDDPQLMEAPAATAPPVTAVPAAPVNEKPAGLAGALPGGLGAGFSSLHNPLGDSGVMGKLGDLATQNPVADVMSKGKSMLFKRFGL